MNALFDAMQTFNALGLLLMGVVFFGIGFAMIADWLVWRARAYKVKARVVAVRSSGKRRSDEEWAEHYKEEKTAEEAESKSAITYKEQFRQKPVSTGFASVLIGLLCMIPFLFFGIGAYTGYNFLSLKAGGERTLARVVDVESSYDSENGYTYTPVLSFTDNSGYSYRVKDSIGSGSNKISVGEEIFVYYDRDDPEHFVMDRFWRYMGFAFAFMGMSSIFIAVFAFAFVANKKSTGLSMNSKQLKAHKRKHYASQMYTAIYEFVTPHGDTIQVPGTVSSSSIADKLPGSEAVIFVRPDKPDRVRKKSFLFLGIGLVFAMPGVWILYVAFSMLSFTFGGFAMMGAAFVFLAVKVLKSLRRFEEKVPRKEWSKFIKENTRKESDRGYILNADEIRERFQYHQSMMRVTIPITFIVALGMMYGGYYMHNHVTDFVSHAHEARGEVVEMRSRSSDDGYTYYAVVSFKTPSGDTVKFEDNVGSSHPLKKRGDEVDVLYDPEKPRDAMIDRGLLNNLPALGLMLVGFLAFLITFKAWRRQRTARL